MDRMLAAGPKLFWTGSVGIDICSDRHVEVETSSVPGLHVSFSVPPYLFSD